MTWVKLTDTFAEDPRIDEAGPLALALHVAALCFCARQLTDGRLPRRTIRRLVDLHDLDDVDSVAKRLVTSGMWAETPDGFEIVDYLDDQPSRAKVLGEREDARERMQRVRANRRSAPVRPNIERNSQDVRAPRPDPTRPDPTTTRTPGILLRGIDLSGLVAQELPPQLVPDHARLTKSCDRLIADGWTVEELKAWMRRQTWSSAGSAGLVIHRLDELRPQDRQHRTRKSPQSRAKKRCPNDRPIAGDGTCCGQSHPPEVEP